MGARGKLKLVEPARGTMAAELQAKAPEMTAFVAERPELREIWEELVPAMNAEALLARVDAVGLEQLVIAISVARRAYGELDSLSIAGRPDGTDGSQKRHPASLVLSKQSEIVMAWAKEYLLTPAVRLRVPAPEQLDLDNPFLPTADELRNLR